MKARRTLIALAACAVTSLAIATAAQAAPSVSSPNSSAAAAIHAAKPLKLKGATYYNFYFDPYDAETGEFFGYHLEPPFFVKNKTRTWGFEETEYGNFENIKVKYKEGHVTVKYTETVFDENFVGEVLECVAIKDKVGWEDGACYITETGEYYGAWYAEKVKK